MQSVNEIRTAFLEYYKGRDHEIVTSAPLVPQSDPTLMFVNAGMVPFKNVFTGMERRPYSRATSSQKCVRAGGKHNDLDNVGYTARHHTFFEMLGNFSFGDYFKEEAIFSAWNLITNVFGLDREKLLVTVYHDDDEAFNLWKKIAGLRDEKIIRIATSDNFWSMGDTGPCGPCSEIFYDHGDKIPGGPPGSVNEDGDRFIEIWNLVFMQYEREADGTQANLPKPSIDTGMGLERVAAVLQGQHDNYETDLFRKLIAASVELTGKKAQGEAMTAHRVVTDHLRSTSFLIADGVTPSSEGRGYVLRRIMRRAMRYSHYLGAKDPLLAGLVPSLVSEMGQAFPELVRAEALIRQTLATEEIRFRSLLERGLKILNEEKQKLSAGQALPGESAFRLYDTYGFPLDLTQDALRREGIKVDEAGFAKAMEAQRAAARANWAGSGDVASETVWFDVREQSGASKFVGYTHEKSEGIVQAIIKEGACVDQAAGGDTIQLVLHQTPFYAESGGQVGDIGVITGDVGLQGCIEDTKKRAGGLHVHQVTLETGTLNLGDTVLMQVDTKRRNKIRANHSATHLLHSALRRNLGEHVTQKGSLVNEGRLRFDFSHQAGLSRDEIAVVEREVNEVIRQNDAVKTQVMSYDNAVDAGAMALFGEKYDDNVRVLTIGKDLADCDKAYSVELCGGTHVVRTGDLGLLVILSEGAVASGVRRLEAMTGEAARQHLLGEAALARQAAEALKTTPQDLVSRAASLLDDRKKMDRELTELRKKIALGGDMASGQDSGSAAQEINQFQYFGRVLEGVPAKELRALVDEAKAGDTMSIAAFIAVNDGKAAITIGVSAAAQEKISAVDLVRIGAQALGGKGGGGRPDMAQAGGPNGSAAQAALDAIATHLKGLS